MAMAMASISVNSCFPSSSSSSACSVRSLSALPSLPPCFSRNYCTTLKASNRRCFSIYAAKLPAGVEAPKEEPKLPVALWGFTQTAEIWNSRAAMIGIIGIFIFELVAGKGLLEIIGFEVGKGLDLPL